MSGKFSSDLRKFERKTTEDILRVRGATAIKLFNAIVLDTPVLSGRLRANWRLSLNQPDYSTTENTDKNGAMAFALISDTVDSASLDDTIIMCNSLPYVKRIEYEGWSSVKAPAGMVRKNVTRFKRLVEQQANS